MRWAHTSRVKPTSRRYLSGAQPIGGPNGIGRYRIGGGVPHRPFDRLRADRRQLRDELVVRQVRALADLQLVDAVDPVVRVDLLVERHAAPELVHELLDRRLRVGRAEHVQRHLADVPRRAVGRPRPLVGGERRRPARRSGRTPPRRALGPRVGVIRSGIIGGVLLRLASSRYRSIESVEMTGPAVAAGVVADLRVDEAGDHRDEAVDVALAIRRPAACSSVDRAAEHRPRRARTTRATARSPGSWRWKSSSQRAGSSTAKSTKRAHERLHRGPRARRAARAASSRSSSCRLPSANIASYSACFESKYA